MDNRRRRKADPLTIILEICAIAGWVGIFGVQIVAWLAAPEMDTSITRFHDLDLRHHWQSRWANYLPILLGLCATLSIIALMVRPMRSRRKTDSKHWNVLVLLILTLIGIAFYWFQVSGNVN